MFGDELYVCGPDTILLFYTHHKACVSCICRRLPISWGQMPNRHQQQHYQQHMNKVGQKSSLGLVFCSILVYFDRFHSMRAHTCVFGEPSHIAIPFILTWLISDTHDVSPYISSIHRHSLSLFVFLFSIISRSFGLALF